VDPFSSIQPEVKNTSEPFDPTSILKAAIRSEFILFQIFDEDGNLVISNIAAEKLVTDLFGTSLSIGLHFSVLFPPLFLEKFQNLWNKSKESGWSGEEFETVSSDDQQKKVIAVRIVQFKANSNKPSFLVIYNDITQHSQVKSNLFNTEANLKAILNSTTIQYILVDKEFKVVMSNNLAQEYIKKIHQKELKTGESIFDFVFEADKTAIKRHINQALIGKESSAERKLVSTRGNEAWLEISSKPIRNGDGKIDNVLISYSNITERKQFEIALRESEGNLNIVFSSGLQGFILLENGGKCLIYNAQAEYFFKAFSGAQLERGYYLTDLAPPDIAARISRSIRMAQNGGRIYSEEAIFENGQKKYFSIQFDPVSQDKEKKVTLWINDITLRKQAELSLQKSESNLKSIFNNTTSTFYLINKEYRIETLNKAAVEEVFTQFGKEPKEGDEVIPYLDTEEKEKCINSISLAFSGRKVVIENFVKTDTRIKWFERHFNPILDEEGKVEKITIWSMDISERKKFENALLVNEKKFRKLTSLSPVGIYQTDENLQIIYLNDSIQKILGVSQTEVFSKKWQERIHPSDQERFQKETQKAYSNHQEFFIEFRLVREEDQSIINVYEQAVPMFDDAYRFTGYLGTLVDITEHITAQRLRSERDLAKVSLKYKSDFLAGMSHEIRTPLNSILSYTELLLDSSVSEDQKDKLQTVFNAAVHLKSIVNDILDLSKLEAGKSELNTEVFSLSSLVEETFKTYKIFAEEKRLVFEHRIQTKLIVESDKRRLLQVMSNLVKNAIKFTDSGKVVFGISVLAETTKTVQIRFEVKDTGKGIPSHELPKLFSDYMQVKSSLLVENEGTGLGLSISKKLIELLGGSIGVESENGNGSCFWFECTLNKSNREISDGHKLGGSRFSGKVLLAEDNSINRMAFQSMLKRLGMQVVAVSNGFEVVEKFQTEAFDLIFMDIQMPGMDGYTTIAQLKELGMELPPIIGLSGNISQTSNGNYLKKGMDDFLAKPATSSDFIGILLKWKIPMEE
jgi:PAS domain S-box-containing protein